MMIKAKVNVFTLTDQCVHGARLLVVVVTGPLLPRHVHQQWQPNVHLREIKLAAFVFVAPPRRQVVRRLEHHLRKYIYVQEQYILSYLEINGDQTRWNLFF